MQLVTRTQWGARPSRHDLVPIGGTKGVKVHYEGTPVPVSLVDHHDRCAARMRTLQAGHLANTQENYSDIAYNYVVCPHGYVYEGRGLHKKTGANGNQSLNTAHYAVCAMLGSEGYAVPTDAQLGGIRDAIDLLRSQGGAGSEILGHRDGYATACPGGPLYAWVQRGAPRPGGTPPKPPTPKPTAPKPVPPKPAPPKPALVPYPGAAWFTVGRRSPIVAAMHDRLIAVGCNHYRSTSNKDLIGSGDIASYEAWQRTYNTAHKKGWSGSALTWPPGKETWDALKVPKS